jgi:hypothetical protein
MRIEALAARKRRGDRAKRARRPCREVRTLERFEIDTGADKARRRPVVA